MQTDRLKDRLLQYHDKWPLDRHPLWQAVLAHELTFEQVIEAEIQHYLRTKAGRVLRAAALRDSKIVDKEIFSALLKIYLEECTHDSTGPSHLDLIKKLVMMASVSEHDLLRAIPTPGNAAAIALYSDIAKRGAGCHLIGAGAVEYFYCTLSPRIFAAYTERYGMTADQAETYKLHGPMDREHAEGAFRVLREAVALHGEEAVELSVRDAFAATSLHYDGMLQAATGNSNYWGGV